MLREILGLALISVGCISLIAHIIATGRRAARHSYGVRSPISAEVKRRTAIRVPRRK
jgi:hypothetical protein